MLVGCGGTGGFLAEAVCRLLLGRRAELYLVDMDRVEAHNVARQAFDRADVGRFKAQVLAERLARRFGREVGYSVLPYDRRLHAEVFAARSRLRLLLGCVDTAAARRAMAETLDGGPPLWLQGTDVWLLDTGNGRNSGQVLLGNATRAEHLRGAFDRERGVCLALPAPSLQRPDLLDAPPPPAPRPDCAEAVADGAQGATINQVIAALAGRLRGAAAGGDLHLDGRLPGRGRRHAALRPRRPQDRRRRRRPAPQRRRPAEHERRRPRQPRRAGPPSAGGITKGATASDCARPHRPAPAAGAGGRACLTPTATPSPAPSPGRRPPATPGRRRPGPPRPAPTTSACSASSPRTACTSWPWSPAAGRWPRGRSSACCSGPRAASRSSSTPGPPTPCTPTATSRPRRSLPPGASVRVERRRPRVADGIVLPFQPAGRPEPVGAPRAPERAGEWP